MKVYKLKEVSEPGVTVVMVCSKLSNLEHQVISSLPGDLFFIFPESITREIDPSKFSNLYGATWYGIYKGDKVNGVWRSLDYIESLTNYLSVSVSLHTGWIKQQEIESLRKLQYSGIETSVFSSRNLTKEEMEKIYTIPNKLFELLFGFRVRIPGKSDNRGMYVKSIPKDSILFLRPASIRGIRELLTPKILESFYGEDPGSFISSLTPEDTYINVKIDEAKI